jgi:hypothetical protein
MLGQPKSENVIKKIKSVKKYIESRSCEAVLQKIEKKASLH